MEDRFKFRAWHKDHNEMVYTTNNFDWFELCKREFTPWLFEVGYSGYPRNDGWIFMQCTGIKASDNNLIYEGDIVCIEYQGDCIKGTIQFKYGSFHFVGSIVITMIDVEERSFELLGNIYENPELLK